MLTCHCTVGVGMPLAVAVKVAVLRRVDGRRRQLRGHGRRNGERKRRRVAGETAEAVGEHGLVLGAVDGGAWR